MTQSIESVNDADEVAAAETATLRGAPPSLWRRLIASPMAWISAGWVLLVLLASLFSGVIGPQDPLKQSVINSLQLPSAQHLLGTDSLGRDVLSRLIAGAAVSLAGAALAVGVAMVIGVPLGLLAGYRGSGTDLVIDRVADFLFALPGIVVILATVATFGTGTVISMTTLGVLISASFIRLVRASTIAVRSELFVDAAKVSGLRSTRIIARHVFPNISAPLIVQVSLTLGAALEIQAGLSFLGLGPSAPAPSWGAMVLEASQYINQRPWLMVPPGLAIIITILAFNFLGDAIRDASSTTSGAPPQRYPLFTRRKRPAAQTPVTLTKTPSAVLTVENLRIAADASGEIVHGIGFSVTGARTVGLVGESGSGKTLTALAILGLLPPGLHVTAGSIRFGETELLGLSESDLAAYRGKRIGYVSQEPMVALDPSFTVFSQLREPLRNHAGLSRGAARARARDLLTLVGIQRVDDVLASYPHQLSGGMAQRVAIAIALTGEPELLIADEPTTALDVTVQADILDLLRSLQARLGMAVLIVTHNFGVVADLCDEVVVMQTGALVESAPVASLFAAPQQAYTRALLAAAPENWDLPPAVPPVDQPPVLAIEDLIVQFRRPGLRRAPFVALRGVSLTVGPGETVGLVGESGSGKTTLGRAALGLVPIHSGRVRFAGADITRASAAQRRKLSSELQVVFQDPYSSLNPKLTVAEILTEPLRVHRDASAADARKRVRELLDSVNLPSDAADRYPREFSGGQRQRIAIARALVMDPKLIVCDEALSALDLTTQERVVLLLREIQQRTGVAYLFIAHDLAVVRGISNRVSVLYRGEVVESGDAEVIGSRPEAEYTKRLLLSAPLPDPVRQAERRANRRRVLSEGG